MKKTSGEAPAAALQTDLAVVWVSTASLKPNPRNARAHNREQIAVLARSLDVFGFTKPIITDGNDVVIAGHGCLEAAKKLGLERVPVIRRADLSKEKLRLYAIADNKLGERSGWDRSLLALELKELQVLELDLSTTGFEFAEIETLFEEHVPVADADSDEIEPVEDLPIVAKPGDLFVLGRHRLLCGDATSAEDVKRLLAGACPILLLTDPPYGVEYQPEWRHRAGVNRAARSTGIKNDDRADWTPAWRLFPGSVAYVWHAGLYSAVVQHSLEAASFEVRSQIIWVKPRLVLSRGCYHWQHEPCLHAVRRGHASNWCGGRAETTVWEASERSDVVQDETKHPTRKPLQLFRRAILNSSRPGQGVFDPFLGSGTTLLAAEKTGRVCYALEIDPKFVDLAIRRWQSATGKDAFLEGSSQTFRELTQERLAPARDDEIPRRRRARNA